MKITDLNSGQDIGSNCLLVQIAGLHILVDAGMHPKRDGLAALPNLRDLPPLDYIVLTHCHLDHLGSLPVVLRRHPRTPILCSHASAEIARRILRNSVNVMTRQRDEAGIKEYPLFTFGELDAVEAALRPLAPFTPRSMHAPDGTEVSITLYPAGHVAGAVGVLLEHRHRKIFFTGDVLFHDQETVPGAQFPDCAVDTLVTETTHGATPPREDTTRASETARLLADINATIARGGSVLIPAFAFGRMHEMLNIFAAARRNGALVECPIHCSGLGVDLCDYMDVMSRKSGGLVRFRRAVLNELKVRTLERNYTPPGQDVRDKGIYLLSSGMLVENTPAWRVAANLLEHAHNTIAFVGYCDPDTPGGRLLTRRRGDTFIFHGLDYAAKIRASIESYYFSGHASRDELVDFARHCDPRAIVITHGDPPARQWFEEEFAIELPRAKVTNPVPGVEYTI